MSIRYYMLLFTLFLHGLSIAASDPVLDNSYPTPKLLVLIIASDDYPVYGELQKLWHSYMHYDREHVEAYFIRGNPELETTYAVQDDVLWTKTPENVIPGIVNKTILSLEALMPRIKNHEFDYVLRTNLSSFYVFPRLLAFLRTCPVTGFYCGSNIGVEGIGSGCGFLMSPDVAQMLVDHKQELYDDETSFDDVVIGVFLKDKGIPLIPHTRLDLFTLQSWQELKDSISEEIFHFRVKNSVELRLTHDVAIQSELITRFYR